MCCKTSVSRTKFALIQLCHSFYTCLACEVLNRSFYHPFELTISVRQMSFIDPRKTFHNFKLLTVVFFFFRVKLLSSFSVFSLTRADSNSSLAFFAPYVTAPHVLTFTALLNDSCKRAVTTPTTHVRTASLPGGGGIAFSSDRSISPSGHLAVIRRRVQCNEVSAVVLFSSLRLQVMILTAVGFANNSDNVIVLFLEERGNVFKFAQSPEASFLLA